MCFYFSFFFPGNAISRNAKLKTLLVHDGDDIAVKPLFVVRNLDLKMRKINRRITK